MISIPHIDVEFEAISSDQVAQNSCIHCGLNFPNLSSLEKHVKNNSGVDSTSLEKAKIYLECKECSLKFTTFRGMRQHYGKIHTNTKRIKCKFCHKRFKDNYAVKYHRKQVHEKSTQIQCHLCEKLLYNRFMFKSHVKVCSQKFFEGKALENILKNQI